MLYILRVFLSNVTLQPFLTPLPPTIPSNAFQAVLHLLGLVLGAFRLAVVLFTVVLYVILVEGVCMLFVCLFLQSFHAAISLTPAAESRTPSISRSQACIDFHSRKYDPILSRHLPHACRNHHKETSVGKMFSGMGLFSHQTVCSARASRYNESWNPSKGDLIISNWASWIEIVWLAAR